eukprot:m51a1_g4741 hypothetical protein (662) ;mRNA; f:373927-375912
MRGQQRHEHHHAPPHRRQRPQPSSPAKPPRRPSAPAVPAVVPAVPAVPVVPVRRVLLDEALPDDCLAHVLACLSLPDLARAARVSVRWRRVVQQSPALWAPQRASLASPAAARALCRCPSARAWLRAAEIRVSPGDGAADVASAAAAVASALASLRSLALTLAPECAEGSAVDAVDAAVVPALLGAALPGGLEEVAAPLLPSAWQLARGLPALRVLAAPVPGSALGELARCPCAATLERLRVVGHVSAADVASAQVMRLLAGLRGLEAERLAAPEALAVARCCTTRLAALSLGPCRPEALACLGVPSLSALTSLRLLSCRDPENDDDDDGDGNDNDDGDEDAHGLRQALRPLRALESLEIADVGRMGDGELAGVLRGLVGAGGDALSRVVLTGAPRAGPATLAALAQLRGLRELALEGLGDAAGVGALASARLETLRLARCPRGLSPRTAARLLRAHPALRALEVSRCGWAPRADLWSMLLPAARARCCALEELSVAGVALPCGGGLQRVAQALPLLRVLRVSLAGGCSAGGGGGRRGRCKRRAAQQEARALRLLAHEGVLPALRCFCVEAPHSAPLAEALAEIAAARPACDVCVWVAPRWVPVAEAARMPPASWGSGEGQGGDSDGSDEGDGDEEEDRGADYVYEAQGIDGAEESDSDGQ